MGLDKSWVCGVLLKSIWGEIEDPLPSPPPTTPHTSESSKPTRPAQLLHVPDGKENNFLPSTAPPHLPWTPLRKALAWAGLIRMALPPSSLCVQP